MMEVQRSTLEMAGSSRLEQIRASLSGDKIGGDKAISDTPSSTADTASVSRLDEIRASLDKDKNSATG